MDGFWTRHIARSRETSLHGEKEPEHCVFKRKRYTDHKQRQLSFEVGDFVYLKVSPMRSLRRLMVRGKLTLRIIGPFKITEEREKY
jgi:hypothetical protein